MLTLASCPLLPRDASLACGSAQPLLPAAVFGLACGCFFWDSVWTVGTGVCFVDVGHRSASVPRLSRSELTLAVFTCACQDTLDYGSCGASSRYLLEQHCNRDEDSLPGDQTTGYDLGDSGASVSLISASLACFQPPPARSSVYIQTAADIYSHIWHLLMSVLEHLSAPRPPPLPCVQSTL